MKNLRHKHTRVLLVTLASAVALFAASEQTTYAADSQAATSSAVQTKQAQAVQSSSSSQGDQSSSVKAASSSVTPAVEDTAKSQTTTVTASAKRQATKATAKVDNAVITTKQADQGPYIPVDQYVTVTAKGYNTWAGFDWTTKLSASQIYQHTYRATGKYEHKNGSTYLSLYNAQGTWQGYINAKAVTVAAGSQGAWLKATGYATITTASQPIWTSFNDRPTSLTDGVLGHTYKITGKYVAMDGSVFYSLYDAKRKWLGYLKNGSFQQTSVAQGSLQQLSGSYQIKTGGYSIWKSFNWKAAGSTTGKVNQYVTVNGQYHHFNGATYDAVYSLSGKWLGYLNAAALGKKVSTPQGNWHADNRYVTISSKGYSLYSDFKWHVKQSGAASYGRILHATGKYYHINGSTYLSLYDNSGKWAGYINQKAVKVTGKQGPWKAASGYTTFTNRNVNTFTTVEGTKVATAAGSLYGNTYKITGLYHTFSGKTFYSIASNKNRWLGYVDAAKIKTTKDQQGLWMSHNSYVTTTKRGQKIWSSLKFSYGISTSTYYQITYQVKGMYHHFNGSTYYSLYKNGGKWLGYVNKSSVTEANGAQGAWLPNGFSVMITSNGYGVYKGFFGRAVANSTALRGNTYKATGKYHHLNGSTYLSLYSGSKWIGYINKDATTAVGSRVLNVPYASQFRPYYAPEGCAAVSLYMVLRYKGVKSVSQKYLLDHLPMYPVLGGQRSNGVYSTAGFVSVIEPSALTTYAKNWYAGAKNISGSPVRDIVAEVLNGNPVIVWGFSPYHAWGGTRSHTHVVVGYDTKKGFKVYDPAYNTAFDKAGHATGNGTTDRGAVYWISVANFTTEWAHQYGHEEVMRAVAFE